jgi:type IV fimbrial biogenesis protein FimT
VDHQLHQFLGNEGGYGGSLLMSRSNRSAGFTMIELIVTLTIFSVLVALTVPTMRTWIADAKVRAVADSLQNGIRLAQTEALRRSRQVVFVLTNSTTPQSGGFTAAANGSYWAVQTIPAMTDGSEGPVVVGSGVLFSPGTPVTITNGPTAICFNSAGRLVTQSTTGITGATCTTPTTLLNGAPTFYYTINQTLAARPLNVQVGLGGQLHLCDPTQSLSTSPYGC